MIKKKTEVLYKKVGRRYVPAENELNYSHSERQPIGSFLVSYASKAGWNSFFYVTPKNMEFQAAGFLFRKAIEKAITEKSAYSANESIKYTPEQQKVFEQAKKMMVESGLLMPAWWRSTSSSEIANAALDALQKDAEHKGPLIDKLMVRLVTLKAELLDAQECIKEYIANEGESAEHLAVHAEQLAGAALCVDSWVAGLIDDVRP